MNIYNPYLQMHYDRLKEAGIEGHQHTNRLSVELAKQLRQQNQYQSLSRGQATAISNNHKHKSRNRLHFVATTILRLTGKV